MAIRMERALQVLGRPTPWSVDPTPQPMPATALWRSPAVGMRTAHDLLATHWDGDGVAVTPQVVPLGSTDARAAGLLDVAGLARIVADSAEALALRAGRAGVQWAKVERLAELGDDLGRIARQLRDEYRHLDDPGWRELEVARPIVRTDDPLLEFADRLARLYRNALSMTRDLFPGVRTLGDFALTGVRLHQAAAGLFALLGPDPRPGDRLGREAERVGQRLRGWQGVQQGLRLLATATPGNRGARADAIRVGALLAGLADADRSSPARSLPAVLHACEMFDDVALWNQLVLDRVDQGGLIYVPANSVRPRDRWIGSEPAKGFLVPAPADTVEPVPRAYDDARGASSGTAAGPPATSAPRPERLEPPLGPGPAR
jgi:hypothetical protein